MLSVKFQKSDPKHCHNKECVGILTDDDEALDMLKSIRKLPNERYQSVSLILEDCRPLPIDRYHPTYQLGTFSIPKQLQPLCSNAGRRPSESRGYPQGPQLRVPPVPHLDDESTPADQQPTGQPHKGVVYPQSYANKPPFACPGYQEQGIKQPTGVIKLPRVPAGPKKGVVNGIEMMVPAWVSPLYKPYGIGGPYGPNGPFYNVLSEPLQQLPDWKKKFWPVFTKFTKPAASKPNQGVSESSGKSIWKSFFGLFSKKKSGTESTPQTAVTTAPTTAEGEEETDAPASQEVPPTYDENPADESTEQVDEAVTEDDSGFVGSHRSVSF